MEKHGENFDTVEFRVLGPGGELLASHTEVYEQNDSEHYRNRVGITMVAAIKKFTATESFKQLERLHRGSIKLTAEFQKKNHVR